MKQKITGADLPSLAALTDDFDQEALMAACLVQRLRRSGQWRELAGGSWAKFCELLGADSERVELLLAQAREAAERQPGASRDAARAWLHESRPVAGERRMDRRETQRIVTLALCKLRDAFRAGWALAFKIHDGPDLRRARVELVPVELSETAARAERCMTLGRILFGQGEGEPSAS